MRIVGAFTLILAALSASAACACSIDQLRKLADQPLDRLPHGAEREISEWKWSTEGGSWQVFQGENATTHSVVVTALGEFGQTKRRISFLSRRDFVIVETEIDYFEHIADPNRSGKFKVQPSRYFFFCDDKVQTGDGLPPAEQMKISSDAYEAKHFLFEEIGVLKPILERLPALQPPALLPKP